MLETIYSVYERISEVISNYSGRRYFLDSSNQIVNVISAFKKALINSLMLSCETLHCIEAISGFV